MELKIFGTRGSVPVAKKEFLEYGGNTSCYLITAEDRYFIIDAGTGIIGLGEQITSDLKPIHIFLSHVHLDHIQGLYNFVPFFQEGREIHIYGEERDGVSIKEQLKSVVRPPFWPVGFAEYTADVHFHDLEQNSKYSIRYTESVAENTNSEGMVTEEKVMELYTHRSIHPDMCMNYRFVIDGKSFVYAMDYEYEPENEDDIVSFCKDADFMIFDGAYIPGKVIKGYGHSSWKSALAVQKKANVKKVLISHFSHFYNDEILREQEELMKKESSDAAFAKEELVVEI